MNFSFKSSGFKPVMLFLRECCSKYTHADTVILKTHLCCVSFGLLSTLSCHLRIKVFELANVFQRHWCMIIKSFWPQLLVWVEGTFPTEQIEVFFFCSGISGWQFYQYEEKNLLDFHWGNVWQERRVPKVHTVHRKQIQQRVRATHWNI